MMSKAFFLSYIEVGSELEAILLESRLINKLKPFYNLISKDDKSPYYIHITKDSFPKPLINHVPTAAWAGPFLNSYIPKRILKLFRKIAPYCTAPKFQKNPCLYFHLGLCNPCPHNPDFTAENKQQYLRNISRLKLLLHGKFSQIKKGLLNEMHIFSKKEQYEEATNTKNSIDYLNLLLMHPIMPEDYLLDPNLEIDKRNQSLKSLQDALMPYYPQLNLHRIETYDISNLLGQNATAGMSVAIDGYIDSKHFRHFKINSINKSDDPAMLAEVISRRLSHSDWPTPNLIVLDGGIPQLSQVKIQIPIISLAKKLETIIIPHHNTYVELNLERNNPGLQLLQHLRDEAHRFSRRLHHKYRNDKMFT